MYSQNNEELFIVEQLKGGTGFFLDIGAYDGKTFSNTLRLVEMGWSGICVEASPSVFPRLCATHKGNPRVTSVLAAVSANPSKLVPWYDSNGDAVSTTSLAHKLKWEAGSTVRFQDVYVYTMPMEAIFEQFGYLYDFINIDVESTNLALFMALPWKKLTKLRVLCIEHDSFHADMEALASAHGFKKIALNPENIILAR